MIKNRYPLPLIADILDGIRKRKVFTKLDLRWEYNNVRIKERDEWKVVFTTHIRAYKPIVMYFGLTNSLATFQTMMNDRFQDLIKKGDTMTFINDILVAMDTEEGHNELVEKVLKRLYHKRSLTNLWLMIWYLRSSKKRSLDNDKRCC